MTDSPVPGSAKYNLYPAKAQSTKGDTHFDTAGLALQAAITRLARAQACHAAIASHTRQSGIESNRERDVDTQTDETE